MPEWILFCSSGATAVPEQTFLLFSYLHSRLQILQATSNGSLVEHEILATKRAVIWQINNIIAKVLREIINLPPSVSYSYPRSMKLTAGFQEGDRFMQRTNVHVNLSPIYAASSCVKSWPW